VPINQQAFFQAFLKSLLSKPGKQHLFLEYFSHENNNRSYYLDTQKMSSVWEKPPRKNEKTGQESVIMNG